MKSEIIIKNYPSIKLIISIIMFYLILIIGTGGVFIFIFLFTWLISYILLNKEIHNLKNNSQDFKRNYPFSNYASVFGNFESFFFFK